MIVSVPRSKPLEDMKNPSVIRRSNSINTNLRANIDATSNWTINVSEESSTRKTKPSNSLINTTCNYRPKSLKTFKTNMIMSVPRSTTLEDMQNSSVNGHGNSCSTNLRVNTAATSNQTKNVLEDSSTRKTNPRSIFSIITQLKQDCTVSKLSKTNMIMSVPRSTTLEAMKNASVEKQDSSIDTSLRANINATSSLTKNVSSQNPEKRNIALLQKLESPNKNYNIFYVRTGELKIVSRDRFSSLKGAVHTYNRGLTLLRIIGAMPRAQVDDTFKHRFTAQGLFDFTFIRSVLAQFMQSYTTVKTITSKINKQFFIMLSKLMIELTSFANLVHGHRVDQVINIILSIYGLIDHFSAQGVDAWLMAGVSLLFPDCLNKLIKQASVFTNVKMLDDISMVQSFFIAIRDFLNYMCNALNLPESVKEVCSKCFDFLQLGRSHVLISQIESTMEAADKDPKIYNSEVFRTNAKNLFKAVDSSMELKDWARKSGSVSDLLQKWQHFSKIVSSYEEADRVEPTTFIFEGPPGTFKSNFMARVVDILGWSSYSHIVPSLDSGKDWYDSYNNEEVFYMDDVGQEGPSQFRCLLNMQSVIKMPLPCADAKLKDTKWFNSHTLLMTSNNFQNLTLMRNDGIADSEALWRRGMVFDFGSVTRGSFTAGPSALGGTIKFKHFDQVSKKFVVGFPAYFKKFSTLQDTFSFADYAPEDPFESAVVWMAAIVKEFRKRKLEFKAAATWDQNTLNNLKARVNSLQDAHTVSGNPVTSTMGATASLLNDVPLYQDLSEEETLLDEVEVPESVMHKAANLLVNNALSSAQLQAKDSPFWVEPTQLIMDADNESSDFDGQGPKKMYATPTAIRYKYQDPVVTPEPNPNVKSFPSNMFRYGLDVLVGYVTQVITALTNKFAPGTTTPSEKTVETIMLIMIFASLAIASGIFFYKRKQGKATADEKFEQQDYSGQSTLFEKNFNQVHNSVQSVYNSIYECDVILGDGKSVACNCMVSGRKIILPAHMTPLPKLIIKIYKSRLQNHILVDYQAVERVYYNPARDVAILSLPATFPSPFENRSSWFSTPVNGEKSAFLISKDGFKPLTSLEHLKTKAGYTFDFAGKTYQGTLQPDYFTYDVQFAGLCGAVVYTPSMGVVGMHVAGKGSTNVGVATFFTPEIKAEIKVILDSDKNLLPLTIRDEIKADTSYVPLEANMAATVPNKSNLAPTPLIGLYGVDRMPADLQKYGSKTLKTVASKSLKPCAFIPEEELEFGRSVLRTMLAPYADLTDHEVIKGTTLLAGLNKKSSNGYNCSKVKTDYIDFDNGEPTAKLTNELNSFKESITSGKVQFERLAWVETLKDEVRNEEKEGKPRSFRIGTIHQQFLKKKYFGKLVEHIISHRKFNKIMVGCNPIKDWEAMHADLTSHKAFDGDIAEWDGKMLSLLQQMLHEEIMKCYRGEDPEVAAYVLGTLVNSIVIIKNEVILTTHSMPSGSFLTAILNSIANKIYTAMWYYRQLSKTIDGKKYKPSVAGFWNDLSDYVYGDDKAVAVKAHYDRLNAVTLRDFFESLQMGFTTSTKARITEQFNKIEEITFLKRGFTWHNEINKIVCPLDLRVIRNSLNFMDITKDMNQVLDGKINAIQRELYLHPHREDLLEEFWAKLDERKFSFVKMPLACLKEIYLDDNYVIPYSFSELASSEYF